MILHSPVCLVFTGHVRQAQNGRHALSKPGVPAIGNIIKRMLEIRETSLKRSGSRFTIHLPQQICSRNI